MTEISWIKLMVHTFDNEKIKIIESMPEGYQILVIWMKLLTQAGKVNDGGDIYFRKDIPYNTHMLATLFNHKHHIMEIALATFAKFDMIHIKYDETIHVSNWSKYQSIEGMERVRQKTKDRVARFRERQGLTLPTGSHDNDDSIDSIDSNVTGNATDNVTVTVSNAPRTRTRTKNKDLRSTHSEQRPAKTTQIATRWEGDFDRFWAIYPNKKGKSAAMKKWQSYHKAGVIDIDAVIAGTEDYARYVEWQRKNRKDFTENFVKHGVTFVNQKAWEDDWAIPTTSSENRRSREVTADDPDPHGIGEMLKREYEKRGNRESN